MIQQVTINTLLKECEIEDIEKHLIFHFLRVRGLDYQNSPFLNKYFSDFSTNEGLSAKVVQLNHIELTDITSDMELLNTTEMVVSIIPLLKMGYGSSSSNYKCIFVD